MKSRSLVLAFASLVIATAAHAQNVWQPPSGSDNKWGTAGNWSGGVPGGGSNVLLPVNGRPFLNVDATIGSLTLQTSAAIFGDHTAPAKNLTVTGTTTIQNPNSFGTHLDALTGSTYTLGTLTNFSNGVLTGHYVCDDRDDLASRVPTVIQFRGANVTENRGEVELYGADALMLDQETGLNALRNLALNSGVFYMDSAPDHSTSGGLTNTGDLYVFGSYHAAPQKLTVNGSFLNDDGYVSISGNAQLIIAGNATNRATGELSVFTYNAGPVEGAILSIDGDLINEPDSYISVEGNGSRPARLVVKGNLTNQGDIDLEGTGSMEVAGVLTLAGGSINLIGTSGIETFMMTAKRIDAAAGTQFGARGTLFCDLVQNGVFSPGASPGKVTVNGSMAFGSTAVFDVELGGTTAGSQYDQVVQQNTGSGGVTLGGQLAVSFVSGFESTIQNTDAFTILTSDLALSGAFSNVAHGGQLKASNGSGTFTVTYNGNNVVLSNYTAAPLTLVSAVSRKVHGGTETIDLPLALTNPSTVESRRGAVAGDHQLVFTFSNAIASANAAVTSGAGSVAGTPSVIGNSIVVDLTGVTNQQKITLTLSNVTDTLGQVLPNTDLSVRMLLGDSNGDGTVNSGDALQTRNRSGAPASSLNFRSDVNSDGTINGGDALIVRSRSGDTVAP